MNQPLLTRRSPLRISYALLILIVFFFLMPFGFRAARLSLGQKENDVKDWLPPDFRETAELTWFADYFVGESFVLATWPGCTVGDARLHLFEQKLRHESASFDPTGQVPEHLLDTYKRARQVGNELQLLQTGDDHRDWGGLDEKWLCTPSGQWYYLTPAGELYRWSGTSSGPAASVRAIKKSWGSLKLSGQLVTAFGEAPTEEVSNPFYNDLSLICAPLFETVETGESIVAELASEGGVLWPIDLTDASRRATVAERSAMERLTGAMFAPAVPANFDWTPAAFREAIPENRRSELPDDFDRVVEATLYRWAEEHYEGSVDGLKAAPSQAQTDAWYAVFDNVGTPPPPRSTCVLVTLTEVGKKNLSYAIGRGVMGGPQGRLLRLAQESGVSPAGPPSMAPPPFDRETAEVLPGMPKLRLGGPPVDNMAIDEEGTVTLVRLVGYSVLLGIVLSYLCFRSVRVTVMVFIVGGSAAMMSMAMVWWTGGKVDAVLMSMPSLVFVLGISGAIHVVNYYRDEVRTRGESGAPGRALRHALLPCTLASVTTAIGLISLFTSNLAPISNFGLYSAIGVIATLGILFSYLPAALEVFTPKWSAAKPDVENGLESSGNEPADATRKSKLADSRAAQESVPAESALSEWWAALGRKITRHHAAVSVSCLLLLAAAGAGLYRIKTSVQLLKLFDPDSRIIHDYAWLEDNFGKLVPMELVLRVPPEMQAESIGASDPANVTALDLLERAEAVSRISQVVGLTLGETGTGVVGQQTSAATFMPPFPETENGYSLPRSIFNDRLLNSRAELLQSDYLKVEESGPYEGSELWRISLRVGALSDVDYGRFITTLRTAVEPIMRAYDTRDELMRQLTTDAEGNRIELSGKDLVLVVGSKKPRPYVDAQMLDGKEVDTDAVYLATLRDLLSNEQIRTPGWFDPNASRKIEIGSPAWEKQIATLDAVIWLGGEGVEKEDFAAAAHVIDASEIRDGVVEPTLSEGTVPDVDGGGALQVVYTGVIPVVYKAQRTLLNSLAHSIGMAFVLIAGVMVMLLNPGRSVVDMFRPGNFGNGLAAGAVSMIPNIFPVLLVFGVMCHLGMEIDIGTMMTASVAMGVAVDDTIHFLSWFRSYLDKGMTRVEAVIETYRRVGPAMTQTTIVGGLGLFVFALSTFTPTQRFGMLMLILLAAALIGDLVLLPALLAGPMGRWFKPQVGRGRPQSPDDESDQNRAVIESNAEEETVSEEPEKELVVEANAGPPLDGGSEAATPSELKPGAQLEEESLPRLRIHFPDNQRPPARRLK